MYAFISFTTELGWGQKCCYHKHVHPSCIGLCGAVSSTELTLDRQKQKDNCVKIWKSKDIKYRKEESLDLESIGCSRYSADICHCLLDKSEYISM